MRAPAVYLVVLFHAGVGAFEGGFIGVDLFFVLSGFLVCHVLLDEVEAHGRVRFARFYARRFRRLLPAALVAITITSAVFIGISPRLERAEFIDDARAALLYVANWNFIASAHDYFGGGAEESPFLHFWSLSLEEQYYLVFPVFLFGAWKLAGPSRLRWLPAILLAPAACSLAFQFLVDDPNRAYYGTDARLYQPLAGAAFAAWLRTRDRTFAADSRSAARLGGVALGLLVVVASSGLGDIPVERRGLLATFLAIEAIAGLEAAPHARAARWLASRPAQYLGEISYGTYLWHWPIILATRRLVDVSPITTAIVASLLATAMASLSHHLIEQPIRKRNILDLLPEITISGGLTVSALGAIWLAPALLGSHHEPVLPRAEATDLAYAVSSATVAPAPTPAPVVTPPPAPALTPTSGPATPAGSDTAAPADPDPGAEPSPHPDPTPEPTEPPATDTIEVTDAVARIGEPLPSELDLDAARAAQSQLDCLDGDPGDCILRRGTGAHIHLIGDSHAAAWLPAFMALAEELDLTLSATTAGSCPWQDQLVLPDRNRQITDICRELRRDAFERVIPALDPDIVIAANRAWDTPDWQASRAAPESDRDVDGDPFTELTQSTIARWLDEGRRVVIMEPVPESAEMDPLECLSGAETIAECAFVDDDGVLGSERLYRELDASSRDVLTIDADRLICPDLPLCAAVVNGEVAHRDSHHLAQAFAATLEPELRARIEASQILEP